MQKARLRRAFVGGILAVAAVVAYLLDPVVDFFERRKIPRTRAILLVFFLAVMLVLTLLATVVPVLVLVNTQIGAISERKIVGDLHITRGVFASGIGVAFIAIGQQVAEVHRFTVDQY